MARASYCYPGDGTARDPRDEFAALLAREFYRAHISLEGDIRHYALKYERSTVGSIPICKSASNGRAACRVARNWTDIRADSRQFFFLWFPLLGTISITQNGRDSVIGTDQFSITYSNKPSRIAIRPNELNQHASLQVALPFHVINRYVPNAEQLAGLSHSLQKSAAVLARNTFLHLFENAESLSDRAADLFIKAALEAIAETLEDDVSSCRAQRDIKAIRHKQILDYIDLNLANPGLTANKVAQGCGISPRYVHFLFKRAGTTFNAYTWKKRLEQAQAWLTQAGRPRESITEIAFKCGYRSVSHFSRSFKAEFGKTPREARNESLVRQEAAGREDLRPPLN